MGMKKNDASKTAKSCTAELMAKRETSAERRAREHGMANRLWIARSIASVMVKGKKRTEELSTDTYAGLGRVLCMCDETVLRMVIDMLEGARSIKDVFLAKRPYTPGKNWYDDKITAAYIEAFGNVWRKLPQDFSPNVVPDGELPWPSFNEFLDIFREQNPKLVVKQAGALIPVPSERSLRRSLERLGFVTRRVKRGPK